MTLTRITAVFIFLATAGAAQAGVIDSVSFGDPISEKTHNLTAERSDVVEGGLGLQARRLLPKEPATFEGGAATFTIKVDPRQPNYLTVKLWGTDRGEDRGRLLLFCEDKQIGYRNEGDYDVLNQIEDDPSYPDRFVYQTLSLPLALTSGHDQITLTIRAIGRIWPYGKEFAVYQKTLARPSRGLYAAYTHLTPRFSPPETEQQGAAPASRLRPGPGPEVMTRVKARVNEVLNKLLTSDFDGKAPAEVQLRQRSDIAQLLAESYGVAWTTAYQNPKAIARIVREGDALARLQSDDSKFVSKIWPGAGPLGDAIRLIGPQLAELLDENIDIGPSDAPTIPRRKAWSNLLRDSRDYWRGHRLFYTNQSMIVDFGVYSANRGLRVVDHAAALAETDARRYLYEATGIEPWRGSDIAGGSDSPYGANYHLVTRKGLTRELGYVGAYGETILHFTADMVRATGDEKLREQLGRLQRARCYFRYPALDSDGYRAMRLESVIDNRTAHYPGYLAYNAADVRENWPMELAAVLKDPLAVGVAQECLEDQQCFAMLERRLKNGEPANVRGLLHAVDDDQLVRSMPASKERLPMSDGQPDFAWADEQDAVVAVRRGEQRLFINFYYRSERGVNGLARVHELTTQMERIATVRTEFELESSGGQYVRPDWIDILRSRSAEHIPPGPAIHQAWAGERLPIAARPADARLPKYGDWGPFVGKASFYRLQYGDYLIGMNCSAERNYELTVPPGHSKAPELISGKSLDLTSPVKVPPLSTVILYLGE